METFDYFENLWKHYKKSTDLWKSNLEVTGQRLTL